MDCRSSEKSVSEEKSARNVRLLSSTTVDSGISMSMRPVAEEGTLCKKSKPPQQITDLVIKIDDVFLPVKKMVLWENSGFFRSILASTAVIDDDDFKILTLHEVNPHDLQYVLSFFEDPYQEVDDLEVLETLELAYTFDCPKLVEKCVCMLHCNEDLHPFDLLTVALKYGLQTLIEVAIDRLAVIPGVTKYHDFDTLPGAIQDRILKAIINENFLNQQTDFNVDTETDTDSEA